MFQITINYRPFLTSPGLTFTFSPQSWGFIMFNFLSTPNSVLLQLKFLSNQYLSTIPETTITNMRPPWCSSFPCSIATIDTEKQLMCQCRSYSLACLPTTTKSTFSAQFSVSKCISAALSVADAEKMVGLAKGCFLSQATGWAPASTQKPSDTTISDFRITTISMWSHITLKYWPCGKHTWTFRYVW